MATLFIVHHTTSPALHAMFESVQAGATDPQIDGVDVVSVAALDGDRCRRARRRRLRARHAGQPRLHVRRAKHFFDQIYYPCLDATIGRPFGVYVHGNNDTTGAIRAVEVITTGLQWRLAQPPVSVIGEPTPADSTRAGSSAPPSPRDCYPVSALDVDCCACGHSGQGNDEHPLDTSLLVRPLGVRISGWISLLGTAVSPWLMLAWRSSGAIGPPPSRRIGSPMP